MGKLLAAIAAVQGLNQQHAIYTALHAGRTNSGHQLAALCCVACCSGDVGIGLNARRLRETFLKRFNVTYSLRPVGEVGTVFRRYPGLWMVFVEEPDLPGR
jgi:hypothetical protein